MTDDRDDDLAREIRTHLALEAEEREADGASPGEARAAAHRAFGNVLRIREDARAVWTPLWVEDLRQDLRYALRALTRSPGFAIVAVTALALGIGATTAIFSIVHSILVRPLPFPASSQVVRVFETIPVPGGTGGTRRAGALTLAELHPVSAQVTAFTHLGMHLPAIRTLTGRDEPVRIIGARISPALLTLLSATPILGRTFAAEHDAPGAEAVVILSHATWQRFFDGNPGVLGQRIDMDNEPHTVIGVMGPDFTFPDPQDQFWIPLRRAGPMLQQRLPLTGRLKDGVPLAAAIAELDQVVTRMRGVSADAGDAAGRPTRFDAVRLIDQMVGPVRTPLLVLMGAVGSVLLIACVNVATLLLGRATARGREIAMRMALGAGRGRLIRQSLTESLVLATLGGIAGIALAFGGLHVFRSIASSLPRRDLAPGLGLPRLDEVAIDGPVLAFTIAATALTGIACGLLPALRRAHPSLSDALRQSAATGFGLRRSHRLQSVLIVAQIALATLLVVGGGLMIRSFLTLTRVHSGYDPTNVLTFQLSLPPGRPDSHLRTVAEALLERLQGHPDVASAGYAESLPMIRVSARAVPLRRQPESPNRRRPPGATFSPEYPDTRFVTHGFLHALSIPIVAGRTFGEGDRAGAPQVLLINRTLAASGLLGTNPVGTSVYALGREPWEVIGIVEDVRQASPADPPEPQIFIDYRQVPAEEPMVGVGLYFGVRTTADPASITASLRSAAGAIDRQAMIENVAPMTALVANALSRPRLYAVLLGLFALVSVILAATGIYGVMTYAVTRRTREIGIRVALGAGHADVTRLVLGQGALITLAGILLGLGAAAAASRWVQQLLFGVTALDRLTFVAVAIGVAAVALAAAIVPLRRLLDVDPTIALRFD